LNVKTQGTSSSLVDSQNILSSGNVINNNFNIINNFMGSVPDTNGASNLQNRSGFNVSSGGQPLNAMT